MNLLVPLALLGLLSVPVILILHLLRNRREQRAIPSLLFWRELEQKRSGIRPGGIPLSLMLLLQLLVAAALTLGLARPALSFLLPEPHHTIFILDTTTSMAATDAPQAGGATARFDMARQVIRTTVQAMPGSDTFALVSLNARPDVIFTGRAEFRAQAFQLLDNLVPGGTGANLPAALSLANGLIEPDRANQIVVLSDGTYTVDPERQALPPLLAPINWPALVPQAAEGTPNQALLNVSARALPDGRQRLFARAVNYGHTPVSRTLRVMADETVIDQVTVQLEAMGETARVWTLPARAVTAAVEIVEPDVLVEDNRADLLLLNTAQQRVLLVSDTPDILARALQAQPGLDLTVAAPGEVFDQVGGAGLAGYDLVVLDGLPPTLTTWPRGNLWVVNPPLGHPLLPATSYGRGLRPAPAAGSPLLEGVDMSGVYFNRAPQVALPGWAEAGLAALPPGNTVAASAAAQPGQPLIFQGSVDNSRIVVWAFDLAESNLPARLALPLLTANTLAALLSPALPQAVPAGEPLVIKGNYQINTPDGRRLSLAGSGEEHRFTGTERPGLYRLYNENDTLVAGFGVHAGSALESNLTSSLRPETLNLAYTPISTGSQPEVEYREFWPWLAGLALVVIVVEGWMAWRR